MSYWDFAMTREALINRLMALPDAPVAVAIGGGFTRIVATEYSAERGVIMLLIDKRASRMLRDALRATSDEEDL